MLHENLIFVLCSPRSGSTLLQRMIGSHSKVYTHPEPHLLTPLNYLGYYDTVDKAPYDHINAAQALRELCEELPNGESDYLDACRAYSSTIYERVLQPTGKEYFLDKTPAYAEVWPFVTKLYPRAKYVVLTRHPMAILHSYAHSFFEGNYREAHTTKPVVKTYVDALGDLLVSKPVPFVHVRYEDLVQNPKQSMEKILSHLGLDYEESTVEYGTQKHITKSYGDPMSVEKHNRPVEDSLEKWAADLLARPEALAQAQEIAKELSDEHLKAWGYPRDTLFKPLEGKTAIKTKAPVFNAYRLKRKVLLGLRKNIHENALGSAVKKVRYYCDVLLRD